MKKSTKEFAELELNLKAFAKTDRKNSTSMQTLLLVEVIDGGIKP
jgi:hypothetical protein